MNRVNCLFPGCERDRVRRGLCGSHSISAHRYIRSGVASEEDLMERGLMAPSRTGTRGSRNAVRDVFAKGSTVKGDGAES